MFKKSNLLSLIVFYLFLSAEVFAKDVVAKKATGVTHLLLSKFGLAMGLVFLCCIFLFVVLSLIKKFFSKKQDEDTINVESQSLYSPQTIEEAISRFINKNF